MSDGLLLERCPGCNKLREPKRLFRGMYRDGEFAFKACISCMAEIVEKWEHSNCPGCKEAAFTFGQAKELLAAFEAVKKPVRMPIDAAKYKHLPDCEWGPE